MAIIPILILPIHFKGMNPHGKARQDPMVGKVSDPRGEPTNVIFLNQYSLYIVINTNA